MMVASFVQFSFTLSVSLGCIANSRASVYSKRSPTASRGPFNLELRRSSWHNSLDRRVLGPL